MRQNMIVLIIMGVFITCSPPLKKLQDEKHPLENTIQNSDSIKVEAVEKEISSDTSTVSEVSIISDVLPVPESNADVQSKTTSVPNNFISIPSGIFQMENNNGDRDETPIHSVNITPFNIGKYEVTQKEYIAVMGNNPSSFKGNNLPIENISWYDAVEYCNRLSVKEGLKPAYSGEGDAIICDFKVSGYRLPTEAEWEYAAGKEEKGIYPGSNDADTVAWYNMNSDGNTHDVGKKVPNRMGLYDMSGNVAEWCWDWYRGYDSENQNSTVSVQDSKTRVVRGGGWGNSEWNLRISARNQHSPVMRNSIVGFRIARSFIEER